MISSPGVPASVLRSVKRRVSAKISLKANVDEH